MHTSKKIMRSKLSIAVGAAVVLMLAACMPGGKAEVDSQPVSTAIPDTPVTITVSYVDDPLSTELINAFMEKYPNVTVDAQFTPFGDYVKSIQRSMASDSAPDIAQYNPGAMRSLIPAGLVLNLDPYRDAYGWGDSFPSSGLEVLSTDDKAKEYGTGSLYAIPGGMSVFGVFYNSDLLKKAGITELPATLSEFEADLKQAQTSGLKPLSIGALQVGAFQTWSALVNVLGQVQDYKDWVYGKPDSTIETPGAAEATAKLVEWIDNGYIPESASAISDSDSLADFVNGNGMFFISGNWSASALEAGMGDNVGFFPFPAAQAGDDKVAPGASVAYSISSKSKHPDVAAAFLNFMSSPEAAQIQFRSGFMPVNTKTELGAEGLSGEIAAGFAEVVDGAGIVPFPGFASPGMAEKLIAGVQGLVTDHMSQADYLASLQAEWAAFHG